MEMYKMKLREMFYQETGWNSSMQSGMGYYTQYSGWLENYIVNNQDARMIKIYKHHLSIDFENNMMPKRAGVGAGATVFLDFRYMQEYLKEDGRNWHYCEFLVNTKDLDFNFKNKNMATILKKYRANDYKKNINST